MKYRVHKKAAPHWVRNAACWDKEPLEWMTFDDNLCAVKEQLDYLWPPEVRWTGKYGKIIVVREDGREVKWDISRTASPRALIRE